MDRALKGRKVARSDFALSGLGLLNLDSTQRVALGYYIARRWRTVSVIISQTAESLTRISETINRGGVIAFRTDTFYGLGADPFNVDAIGKIKNLKGREDGKPILIVISDRDQVDRFISGQNRTFRLLAERLWPGPLTLIGSAAANVPEAITAGSGTVGVRLPDDDQVRALVRACGGALTATSANPANHPPAKTAADVWDYFRDTVELIVDGGTGRSDLPSTVVDICQGEPRLIREGAIAWAEVQKAFHSVRSPTVREGMIR